jgi:hypothetical protein
MRMVNTWKLSACYAIKNSLPIFINNLSKIIYIDEKQQEYNILFSIVAREKSTFKRIDNSVEVFGEHSKNYFEFFGMR